MLGTRMLIEKVPVFYTRSINISVSLWFVQFGFSLDSRQVALWFLNLRISHYFGYGVIPRDNPFFADNTFKGRLARMWYDHTRYQ